jgi:hypothetical protein
MGVETVRIVYSAEMTGKNGSKFLRAIKEDRSILGM